MPALTARENRSGHSAAPGTGAMIVHILAALASEHRLRIVELLRTGECCVCEITPKFDLDPSVVSRHLAVLERAGIISSRRQGRWIHYRLADRRVLKLLAVLEGTVTKGTRFGRRHAC
ncbi:MAG: metalloregulator ArsR/SmtB family transcription factor [candidate division WOR-3 bacterium]